MLEKGTKIIVGNKYAKSSYYRDIVGKEFTIESYTMNHQSGLDWYSLVESSLYIRAEDALPIDMNTNASAVRLLRKDE